MAASGSFLTHSPIRARARRMTGVGKYVKRMMLRKIERVMQKEQATEGGRKMGKVKIWDGPLSSVPHHSLGGWPPERQRTHIPPTQR